jgi:DNA modification methylase
MDLNLNTIYLGDSLNVLKRLPDESVDCCVTSPPYFGLRDYGTARWIGGDPECDHICIPDSDVDRKYHNRITSSHILRRSRKKCPKCGAIRVDKQIGIEDTPEQYVRNLLKVFKEVRRVLKDDGTLWLILGDTYNGYKGNSTSTTFETMYAGHRHQPARKPHFGLESKRLKQKDLIGIPWMVAFALRDNGWYLRQDIIWQKPNPMPESVKDRCTKSHEYIFLLSKSPRYYYDANAISEPIAASTEKRMKQRAKGVLPENTQWGGGKIWRQEIHCNAGCVLSHEERARLRIQGTEEQTKRLDCHDQAMQGSPFCDLSAGSHCALHPCRMPRERHRTGSFHRFRNHRDSRKETGAILCRYRDKPEL